MNKFVATAFKAIALAMIFVVVWSVVFYLYRAYSLNKKMEAIMTTMEQEVSTHNYMTEDVYHMYEGMLQNIQSDMNNGDEFIQGFRLNYSHPCAIAVPNNGLTYSKQLNTPADYGDVAIIELAVGINALDLLYDPSATSTADELQIGENGITTIFTYTSQVPCLRYISVTE